MTDEADEREPIRESIHAKLDRLHADQLQRVDDYLKSFFAEEEHESLYELNDHGEA